MSDWTEKYRPRTLSELQGNDKSCEELREWAETWPDHREAAVVHGSPGVGKTSAAHALANDLGWPVMEMNASDDRGKDVVRRVAGEASKSSTLTQATQGETERRLLVLDEADNLSGTADYGGARAMTDVVKSASQPVVLIANDYYELSRGLRNATREIEFRDVSARSIVPALRNVCRREGIEFEEAALERIAERTDGDLRSAINDLQAVAEGRDRLTVEDVGMGERDRTEGIFDYLDFLLQEADAEEALRRSYDVDETPDDLIRWIDENVPREYDADELPAAYERLAVADRWLGRVAATQNYSYWRYAGDSMTAGVAAARAGPKGGWTRYSPPTWFGSDADRDEVARKVAETAGVSVAVARRAILPFLSEMTEYCRPRELTVAMAARYDLDEAEVALVTGSGETTNKVQSIVEEARERREEAALENTGDAFAPPVRDDGDGEGGTGDDGGSADGAGGGDGEDGEDDVGEDDAGGPTTLAAAVGGGAGTDDTDTGPGEEATADAAGGDGGGSTGRDGQPRGGADGDGAAGGDDASGDDDPGGDGGRDDDAGDDDGEDRDPADGAGDTDEDDRQTGLGDFV